MRLRRLSVTEILTRALEGKPCVITGRTYGGESGTVRLVAFRGPAKYEDVRVLVRLDGGGLVDASAEDVLMLE